MVAHKLGKILRLSHWWQEQWRKLGRKASPGHTTTLLLAFIVLVLAAIALYQFHRTVPGGLRVHWQELFYWILVPDVVFALLLFGSGLIYLRWRSRPPANRP